MSESSRYTFERPYRALGVKIFNGIGGITKRLGLQPTIDPGRILKAAERATGLHDFGSDDFREPLQLLAHGFEHEAGLNPFGHYVIRKSLQQYAQNRLLLVDAWKRHPEFLRDDMPRPLYVVGMPRTGTTLLYNLLCQDPHARPLMIWETLYPAVSRRSENRRSDWWRRQKARMLVNTINRLAPTLKQVHAVEPDGPEEDGWLLNNTFVSLMFLISGRLPGYLDYFEKLPNERWMAVYGFYRQSLQLLQAGDTSRHWILKSPVHQGTMRELLEAVPGACVVYTHRDPVKVIPSLCSLMCTTRAMLSDDVDPRKSGPEILSRMLHAIERARQAEQNYSDRIHNVFFDSLVKDPVGTVRGIYDRFGYKYTAELEAGMQRWLADNPQGKHGAHKYEPEQFGITEDDIRQHFGEYWQRMQSLRDAA